MSGLFTSVIASECEAIQVMIEESSGLPRRPFGPPRNDALSPSPAGEGVRREAHDGWGLLHQVCCKDASLIASKTLGPNETFRFVYTALDPLQGEEKNEVSYLAPERVL